ncbi:hypothetical protein ABT033_37575 [Streptomyces pharetrae]|uniref:hypothetical protein n=1 Tax=Streptomyces pharetrae TaxID=291370 RepID=UPI00334B26B5
MSGRTSDTGQSADSGRRTRPWARLRGHSEEANRLARLLREWLDTAGLRLDDLHRELKPEHFENGTVPSRTTVADRLAGVNPRWDFVTAVAAVCSADRGQLDRLSEQARPLYEAVERAKGAAVGRQIGQRKSDPGGALATAPGAAEALELIVVQRHSLALSDELLRALHRTAELEKARNDANQMVLILLALVDKLHRDIATLAAERDRAAVRSVGRHAGDDVHERLRHSEAQRARAETELARARAEREKADRLAEQSAEQVRRLTEELARLRRDLAAPGAEMSVADAAAASTAAEDMAPDDIDVTLMKAARILDDGAEWLEQIAEELKDGSDGLSGPDNPVISGVTRHGPPDNHTEHPPGRAANRSWDDRAATDPDDDAAIAPDNGAAPAPDNGAAPRPDKDVVVEPDNRAATDPDNDEDGGKREHTPGEKGGGTPYETREGLTHDHLADPLPGRDEATEYPVALVASHIKEARHRGDSDIADGWLHTVARTWPTERLLFLLEHLRAAHPGDEAVRLLREAGAGRPTDSLVGVLAFLSPSDLDEVLAAVGADRPARLFRQVIDQLRALGLWTYAGRALLAAGRLRPVDRLPFILPPGPGKGTADTVLVLNGVRAGMPARLDSAVRRLREVGLGREAAYLGVVTATGGAASDGDPEGGWGRYEWFGEPPAPRTVPKAPSDWYAPRTASRTRTRSKALTEPRPDGERRTETTLTTRIRINIPGSRPFPPVVMRGPDDPSPSPGAPPGAL